MIDLEERVVRIEGILEQVDRRMDYVNRRIDDVNARLSHLELELRTLKRDLNSEFPWLLGVQISMNSTLSLYSTILSTSLNTLPLSRTHLHN